MEQSEITARNYDIAIMLGLKPLKSPYEGAFQTNENTERNFRIFFNGLLEDESWYTYPKFHSDWNWIMESIKFISNLNTEDFSDDEIMYFEDIWNLILFTSIENVFIRVSNFAKAYNKRMIINGN
jgi:hypothetical protein